MKSPSRLRCPFCGGPVKVTANRIKNGMIMIRYRRCISCNRRSQTVERYDLGYQPRKKQ